MKPLDLRAAGLSDNPEDWDGVNAVPLDESDLSDATQARPEDVAGPSSLGFDFTKEPDEDPAMRRLLAAAREQAYVISDEDGLRRAFSAIRHARFRLRQNERMQAPEVEALERELAALKEANARANAAQLRDIAFYENAVAAYALTHRKEVLGSETPREGEKKTRDYGIGRISYRASGGEYRWRQDMTPKEREAALLCWAENEADTTGECLTRDNPKPDLDAIKRHLGALGAEERAEALGQQSAPPGLEWVPEHEDVTVKVASEEK